MFCLGCEVSSMQKKEESLNPLLNHNSNTVLGLGYFVVKKEIIKSVG